MKSARKDRPTRLPEFIAGQRTFRGGGRMWGVATGATASALVMGSVIAIIARSPFARLTVNGLVAFLVAFLLCDLVMFLAQLLRRAQTITVGPLEIVYRDRKRCVRAFCNEVRRMHVERIFYSERFHVFTWQGHFAFTEDWRGHSDLERIIAEKTGLKWERAGKAGRREN